MRLRYKELDLRKDAVFEVPDSGIVVPPVLHVIPEDGYYMVIVAWIEEAKDEAMGERKKQEEQGIRLLKPPVTTPPVISSRAVPSVRTKKEILEQLFRCRDYIDMNHNKDENKEDVVFTAGEFAAL